MFYYRDNNNNLVSSTREVVSNVLTPITEEEYMAAIELLKEQEA